jgi:hypothetical protein
MFAYLGPNIKRQKLQYFISYPGWLPTLTTFVQGRQISWICYEWWQFLSIGCTPDILSKAGKYPGYDMKDGNFSIFGLPDILAKVGKYPGYAMKDGNFSIFGLPDIWSKVGKYPGYAMKDGNFSIVGLLILCPR